MLTVIKANGQPEPFSTEKVFHSLKRTGIPQTLQEEVVTHVKKKAYESIPTSQIHYEVGQLLKHSPYPYSSAKYNLKQAIMLLGPTGYPFEDFVSELLQTDGYKTDVRKIIMGKCVSHEIDVIAEKDNKKIMIEVKFHNSIGTRSDVHVPMYTKSRFEDIKEKHSFHEAWVITNTKATTDAITYAQCVGMNIISWSHPENRGLRDMIEESGMHPITTLTTLSLQHKAQLLARHIVICKNLRENFEELDFLDLTHEGKKKIKEELDFICNS